MAPLVLSLPAVTVLLTVMAVDGLHPGYSLHEASKLLMAVEDDKKQLFEDLATIQTMCAAAEDNVDRLENNVLPYLDVKKGLQDYDISRLALQAKSIQHRVDAAQAGAAETLSITEHVHNVVQEQLSVIEGPTLGQQNDEQQALIDQLQDMLVDNKTSALSRLDEMIDLLNGVVSSQQNNSGDLGNFIYDRKCEYGFHSFSAGTTDVEFKTSFTATPSLSLRLVGFSSHLDMESNRHDYQHYDPVNRLALNKYVKYVNTTGFGVTTDDLSQGSVLLKSVYCSWSACENLDQQFVQSSSLNTGFLTGFVAGK